MLHAGRCRAAVRVCGDGAKLGAGVEVGERRGNGDGDRDGERI
jgi:hypothetical protein